MSNSLFDRLGGTTGISAIVDDVVAAHMANPAIQVRFLPYLEQPERMASIRQHTIDFFSAGSGGAVNYSGRDMTSTHRGMNISAAEYMHAVDDVLSVLDKHCIDAASRQEVLAILWSLKDLIIAK
jgi:hemoglobin